jgi:hypothetical protein
MRGIDAVLQGYTGYGEKAVRTAEPIRQAGGYKHSLRPGAGSGPIVGYIARQLDPLQWSDLIGRPRTHPQGARCATCGVRSRGPRPALGWSSRHGPVSTVEHVSNDSEGPMIQRRALSKPDGDLVAVDGLSFTARTGQVTGALGAAVAGTAAPLAVRPTARQPRQTPPRVHFGAVPTPPTRACGEPTARASAIRRCTDAARH